MGPWETGNTTGGRDGHEQGADAAQTGLNEGSHLSCLTSVCHAGAEDGAIGGAEGAQGGEGNRVDGKLIRLDKMGCSSCRG